MSNLLDKASIILTPTAYNNGEALCVKPSDGSGDFDFSRNSAATRVNAQGLVENVQILSSNLVQNPSFSEEGAEEISNGSFSQEGSELITNGNFSNGSTDWILDNGWSVSDNKALCDGTNLAYITQTAVLTTGKSYKVQFDIVDYTSGSVKYRDNGFVSGQSFSGVGSYTDYVVAGGGQFRLMSENFTGSIDNVSVREVGQDWSLGTGWSIGEDKAIFDGAGFSPARTNAGLITGKTYKVTFDLDITSGNVVVQLGGATNTFNTSTTHTFYDTATANGAYSSFVSLYSSLTSNFSITNISVKEVGQNWETDDANITIQDGYARFNNPNIYKRLTNTPTTNIVQGKIYKAKCTVTNYVSGACYFRMPFNNATGANRIEQNGEYEFISVADNNYSNIVIASATSNANMDITNISLIEITDDTSLPRINYEGFSYQDDLGSEQIVNGTFNDGSNWTTLGGWSIGGGSANCNGGSIMYTNGGIEVSKTYKVTYTIINYVSGNVRSIFNGSTTDGNGTTRNANGTFTELVQSTDNASGTFSFGAVAGSFIGSIDNVSVKEYLGQEVVPDSGCGSWLFEPQSTNLITQSELFSDASWSKSNCVIGSEAVSSPSGVIGVSSVTNTSLFGRLSTIQNVNIGISYTYSFWCKNIDITTPLSIYLNNSGIALDTFTPTSEWVRYQFTWISSSTITETIAIQDRIGTALGSYMIWGAQLEQQTYATSYIPTEGSQVTRNQDLCTNGGSLASINSTEGTLYFEGSAINNDSTNKRISLSDSSSANRVILTFANNTINYRFVSGGLLSANIVYNSDTTINKKYAITWKLNEFKFWVNGIEVGIDTSGAVFPLNTLYEFNFADYTATTLPFLGKTKALAVWKEALSDQELAELTTI